MNPGPLWETNAENIRPDHVGALLYKNDVIKSFLARDNKHFLIATKGVGKTLILKQKRYLLERVNRLDKKGMIFIPIDRPYLDHVTNLGNLSSNHQVWLVDLENSKMIWAFSIMVSAISHYTYATKKCLDDWNSELSQLSNERIEFYQFIIQRLRGNSRSTPCEVLRRFVALSYSQIERVLEKCYPFIEEIYSRIQSGISIFIDRLDQALTRYDIDVWVNLQNGLIVAAWDLMRINDHVKIYMSIRMEAFSRFISADREAISSEKAKIVYTKEDLVGILNKHTKFYENDETFYDFIGRNRIERTFSGSSEDSFNYVQRHCVGRPRDFVAICSSISPFKADLSDERFREIVNRTASEDIVKNIFSEVEMLLHVLGDANERERFLSLIPSNVLTINEIQGICRDFNGKYNCSAKCKKCDGTHPFCDLYNCGLLGIVRNDEGKYKQKFIGPYDDTPFSANSLPITTRYYFFAPLSAVLYWNPKKRHSR